MGSGEHPRIREYLHRFDEVASALPLPRRRSLRQEIRSHLVEAIPSTLPDADAEQKIRAFGPPEDIVGQEIADGPPRPSRAAPKVRRSRPLLVVIAAGLVVVAAAVTGIVLTTTSPTETSIVNANPKGVPRVTTGDAYFDYLDTIKTIKQPLPPGATYPVGVPAGLNSGPVKGGAVEFGLGSDAAHFTWLCAWEADYLTDVKDKNVQRRVVAERMLTWWATSPWWKIVDPDHVWAQNVVGPMRFGDSSGVRSDVGDSCMQAGING